MRIEAIDKDFRAVLGTPPPTPAPEILARVDAIWAAERTRRGSRLFNGRLFSIAETGPAGVIGWLAEYRWFLAQRRDPTLAADLRVRPLAVTGLLVCPTGVVVGRRSLDVEQDPGCWELVPSGGVDDGAVGTDGRVDLGAAVLAELAEEIGLSREALAAPPEPFARVEDDSNRVTDIALRLRTERSEPDIQETFAALANREYLALRTVDPARPDTWDGIALAPASRAILAAAEEFPA